MKDPVIFDRTRICLKMRATTSANGANTAWSGAVNAGATAYTHRTVSLRAGPHSHTTANTMMPLTIAQMIAMGMPMRMTKMW